MKQKQPMKGQFSGVTGYLKKGVLTAALSVIFAAQALAYGFWVDTTNYVYMNSPYGEPTYQIVRKEMEKTYKGHEIVDPVPVIAVAEIDLNGDKFPEMIAYPTEQDFQEGDYCDKETLCPHYVIEVRGNKVRTLGIIYSRFVSRGDNVKNGYWVLRAYNKGEADPKYFDTYIYDKKKDGYVLEAKAQ